MHTVKKKIQLSCTFLKSEYAVFSYAVNYSLYGSDFGF